jgi:hypothetical protein
MSILRHLFDKGKKIETSKGGSDYVPLNPQSANLNSEKNETSKGGNGYGMSSSDPVMAVQPNRYFRHLRCPANQGIEWRRRGSTIVNDMSYIKRRGGITIPGATLIPPSNDHVAVDIYTLECECGKHCIEEVFVDSYHNALDQCIDVKGWTFVDAFPDRRTLQAGEVTSRE